MARIKYWIPKNDQTEEDAYECDNPHIFSDPEWDAQTAADDYWSNHDGWEDKYPYEMALRHDGEIYLFMIECEYEPQFMATRVKS